MGGEIKWESLNDVAEYLEIMDMELFIDCLTVLLEDRR